MGTVQDGITRPYEAQHRAAPATTSDGIVWGNIIEVVDYEG